MFVAGIWAAAFLGCGAGVAGVHRPVHSALPVKRVQARSSATFTCVEAQAGLY